MKSIGITWKPSNAETALSQKLSITRIADGAKVWGSEVAPDVDKLDDIKLPEGYHYRLRVETHHSSGNSLPGPVSSIVEEFELPETTKCAKNVKVVLNRIETPTPSTSKREEEKERPKRKNFFNQED